MSNETVAGYGSQGWNPPTTTFEWGFAGAISGGEPAIGADRYTLLASG